MPPIDYSEYCDDWHQISEYIRFQRAENHCETCGAENHKPHPETGSKVILTVAHINHDKDDNRYNPDEYDPEDEENNLVAECQKCHLARDRHRHIRNRKYGRDHDRKPRITPNTHEAMTWKQLKDFLEQQGIKDTDNIAQLQIEEGFTDDLERAQVYFDEDKDGNRRLYVYFKDE